jgi:hypothetical protein
VFRSDFRKFRRIHGLRFVSGFRAKAWPANHRAGIRIAHEHGTFGMERFFSPAIARAGGATWALKSANEGGADHAVPLGCSHNGVDLYLWPRIGSSSSNPFRYATVNCHGFRQAAERPPRSAAPSDFPTPARARAHAVKRRSAQPTWPGARPVPYFPHLVFAGRTAKLLSGGRW